MDNKKSMELFRSGSIAKAVCNNALPAMAAMLMVLVYNLADTFFIGQTHDDLQVAAVSLATPVFLLFMALGSMFGIGGTSVISRAMGEGRYDYAKKVSAFCMWGCVAVGIMLSAGMLAFISPLLSLIGASAETWNFAKIYLMIVAVCGPFVLIANCYSNVIRAEGESAKAMMGTLIGNLLNVLLDPLLILGFGWDIAGAAIATVIGNVVGAGYYILYFLRGKSLFSISIREFTIKDKVAGSVLAIGVPAALGSVLMSVSQIVINSKMSAFGDMAVAAMGVAMKVVTITGMVSMGLGQGVQPVLGYCAGARLRERFTKVLKFSLRFAFILGGVLTGMCYVLTKQIVSVFLTDSIAFRYAVQFSRILLTTSVLFGVFYVLMNALQAMGAAKSALVINVSRQGIIFIPAVFLLNEIMGMTGLVWAQPVADMISLAIACVLYKKAAGEAFYESEVAAI